MTTLAAKIRAYHPSATPQTVAKALGCSAAYVSAVRYKAAKPGKIAAAQKRRQVRLYPEKAASGPVEGAGGLKVIEAGDVRHAAWCQYWRNLGAAGAAHAATLEAKHRPALVATDYPPDSLEVQVDRDPNGCCLIPPFTPEWASFVAYERGQGARGRARAALMTANPGTLRTGTRWAPWSLLRRVKA